MGITREQVAKDWINTIEEQKDELRIQLGELVHTNEVLSIRMDILTNSRNQQLLDFYRKQHRENETEIASLRSKIKDCDDMISFVLSRASS